MIIAVANQKGGVGKTTTAVTLGHGLAIQGKRVVLVDLDPQGQVATSLGLTPCQAVYDWLVSDRPLAEVVHSARDDLYMIPGNSRTSSAQALLNFEGRTLQTVRRKLAKLAKGTDFVIVDTAPSIGGLQEAALLSARLVIVPTATNYLSSEGVLRTFATLKTLQGGHRWRGGVFGILPTFYDSTTLESKATLDDLRETFGVKLVLTPIHRATAIERCAGEGKTIWERARKERCAVEYGALVWGIRDVRG